jgi:protein-tyrosine phosphatase
MLQQYCKINKNVDINIITPKTEYMERFLDLFRQKYNSVEEYLSQIGLGDSEIMKLKMRLINHVR